MNRKFQFVIYAPLNEFNRNAIAWPTPLNYILTKEFCKKPQTFTRSFIHNYFRSLLQKARIGMFRCGKYLF
jgi:hypothetical protein